MKTRLAIVCLLLLAVGMPASAHRLDEYLQATTISLGQDRIQAQMRLSAGVAVFPGVFAAIDSDGDGALSAAEQRAYAERVLGDLSLTVNGTRVPLRLISCNFGKTEEMKEGRGDIQLEWSAAPPRTGADRKLVFENHHRSRMAIYLVNCLVPSDPSLQVTGQQRDYLQSRYELDYVQAGLPASAEARAERASKEEGAFDDRTPSQGYVRGSLQGSALVAARFLIQGVTHIFTGPDHILFLVGLLLLGGTLKQLLKIVTAFTVAHSVTLCLAALNILHPSARIIEPTIALSIVIVGVHSMVMQKRQAGETSLPDLRLLFAFAFGLIHGFGFASALQELELPRQALVTALFSFHLGVECGQACIVLVLVPLLALLHRKSDRIAQRLVTVGSFAVIAAGAFWFMQRVLAD